MKKTISLVFMLTLLVNVTACGTLMYPERRGQTSGRIDPGVAILDGVGLLLFVIPGLIAYAVDFSTGAIYVPGGRRASADGTFSTSDMRKINVDKDELTEEKIHDVVAANLGEEVASAKAEIYRLDETGRKVRVN